MEHTTRRSEPTPRSHNAAGLLLATGAVALVVGGLIHGPQPGTLEAYAERAGAGWTFSHVLIALAGALFGISAPLLGRRFAGAPGEAWGLAGTGALLLTGVGFLAVGALETTGFATVLGAAEAAEGAGGEAAYLATTAVMASVATAAGYTLAAAVVAYGAAMVAGGSSAWLGSTGVVVGVGYAGLTAFGLALPVLPQAPFYLLGAWLAVAGGMIARRPRAAG